jgi:hypothetical protein
MNVLVGQLGHRFFGGRFAEFSAAKMIEESIGLFNSWPRFGVLSSTIDGAQRERALAAVSPLLARP